MISTTRHNINNLDTIGTILIYWVWASWCRHVRCLNNLEASFLNALNKWETWIFLFILFGYLYNVGRPLYRETAGNTYNTGLSLCACAGQLFTKWPSLHAAFSFVVLSACLANFLLLVSFCSISFLLHFNVCLVRVYVKLHWHYPESRVCYVLAFCSRIFCTMCVCLLLISKLDNCKRNRLVERTFVLRLDGYSQ